MAGVRARLGLQLLARERHEVGGGHVVRVVTLGRVGVRINRVRLCVMRRMAVRRDAVEARADQHAEQESGERQPRDEDDQQVHGLFPQVVVRVDLGGSDGCG